MKDQEFTDHSIQTILARSEKPRKYLELTEEEAQPGTALRGMIKFAMKLIEDNEDLIKQ
jgi:hypothetical protein